MALAEDAATVLEDFVQNVANLPAEIAHLLEEIQAKDRVIQECRSVVNTRDNSIQKFVKANGAGQTNPKEDSYVKNVMANFDKAQIVQEEKVGLSEKAATLLDRQIKRLDIKIQDLQNEGAIAIDPQLPSLLKNNTHRLPPLSGSTTGASTPLHPLSGNAGPSTTIANNNPLARLAQSSATSNVRQASPATVPVPPITTNGTASALGSTLNPNRSSSTDPSKRRRMNLHGGHLAIPPTSSNLRQSSLGPGTPKPLGAQVAARGSSVGPRPTTKKPPRTGPPHQRIGHLNPTKKISSSVSRRRLHSGNRKSGLKASTPMSDSASISELDGVVEGEGEGSDPDGMDIDVDGETGANAETEDTTKYCTCRQVSSGDMVACDNDDCPYEWFHWKCVGIKEEPKGAWFCPECRQNMGK